MSVCGGFVFLSRLRCFYCSLCECAGFERGFVFFVGFLSALVSFVFFVFPLFGLSSLSTVHHCDVLLQVV